MPARPPKARAMLPKTFLKCRTARSRRARSPRRFSRRPPNWAINLTCCGAKSSATWRSCAWRRSRRFASEIFLGTRRQAALARASVFFAQVGKVALAGIAGDRAQLALLLAVIRRNRRKEPGIIPQTLSHHGLHPPLSIRIRGHGTDLDRDFGRKAGNHLSGKLGERGIGGWCKAAIILAGQAADLRDVALD